MERYVKIPKKTWDILRVLTTGKKEQPFIENILTNGKTLTDPSEIANEFNSFFTRVGRNIADAVEPTSREPTDYIPPPVTQHPPLT